jgi:hypothetical protein
MKQKAYQGAFPVTLVVVMAVFLSTLFFAGATLSFAASTKEKPAAIARPSAVEQTEAHIKELQGALNITEAQKGLWNNLTQVMRENAKNMDALTKDRDENTKPMNAVEHMEFHSQVTEAHLDQLKKLIPPFEALYASMSVAQKETIDTIFRTGKDGKTKGK